MKVNLETQVPRPKYRFFPFEEKNIKHKNLKVEKKYDTFTN